MFFQIFIGDVFLKKLGLDSIWESWDLKIRIPRRKLRIWSYSQVETRQYRSKYFKNYVFEFSQKNRGVKTRVCCLRSWSWSAVVN